MRAVLTALVTPAACFALWAQPVQAYERPWLGTYTANAAAPRLGPKSTRWRGGALVGKSDGPAKSAGVLPLDVIVELEGEPIDGVQDLICRIAAYSPGTRVAITLVRERQQVTLTVTLGLWPDPATANTRPRGCEAPAVSATERLGHEPGVS